ncbi:MAG: hypothetical protein MJ198_10785, partial [Bacteroidales bacterium]|nr:hypothetical protein [Bacteroidales bacterium]
RFNPGKSGEIFPPKHPYYPKGCGNCDKWLKFGQLAYDPNKKECQVCRNIKICKNNRLHQEGISVEEKVKIYQRPLNEQFVEEQIGNGVLKEHILLCKTDEDYPRVRKVAERLAQIGNNITMNPEVNYKEEIGRAKIYPYFEKGDRANPDLFIEGLGYVDVKSPENINNIVSWGLKASIKQHAAVCITDLRLKKTISTKQIHDRTMLLFDNSNYSFDYVLWYIDGEVIKLNRRDFK